ncbi:MAG TPA: oxidoreductase, partial [Rhodospirillum rubrum]|nr:oxidoreductase [Rhodospirillum rubrum]
MSTTQVFLGAFAVLAALPVLTLLAGNRKSLAGSITLVGVGVACLAMLGLAVTALTVGPIAFDLGTVPLFGLTSSLAFTIDGLSAIFVILISVLGTASALYSVGYIAHYPDEDARRYYVPFPLFIAGMLMVATTSDWFCFFFGWEFMTLVSYFLVTFENRDKENLSAGFIYFFMTQLTSMGLMLAIIVLGTWGGSTSFAAVAKTLGALQAENPVALYGLLSLFFIGFATKAGMFPLGIWLPKAHPAAPASVSALLSGVMIKLGIYGMLRIFLWALPLGEATHVWGMVITLFGVLSMLVGTLRALGEHDCKRLLAQHSIGQMGYVLLGLGLGLTFLGSNPLFAALGFLGCLYHLINHACFKSLLFFNTGSILYRAGTRDLDSLGGLSAVMPLTAGCALVGALSIAGTPPFNGFVSKWLLYQSAIFGDVSTPVYILAAVVAIFIGTVTLASFVKYMGTAYLGTLPKRFVGSGFGCPRSMEAVEVFLAVVCLVMGVFPGPVVATLLGYTS